MSNFFSKNNMQYKDNLEIIGCTTFQCKINKSDFSIEDENKKFDFLQNVYEGIDISRYMNVNDIKSINSIVESTIENKENNIGLQYKIIEDSKEKWVYTKINIEYYEKEIVINGAAVDVTDLKIQEDKVNYIEQKDAITGLHNRYYLKEHINEYINKNKNNYNKAALVLIDLDKFKYVNDFWGHDYGDLFLKTVAAGFLKIIDDDDLLCRFGGDEFIIFIPNVVEINEVQDKVESIIGFFKEAKNVNGKSIHTSASIGISVFPNDAVDFKNLLKNADAAMYAAKSNGRSTYQFYNREISSELTRIYEIEKGLRSALEKEEIYVEFQPKVILEDNKIQGFEALMRWTNKELGFVSPAEFIPVAENTKLILPISRFLLEEVFKRAKELKKLGYDDFKIAINLSEIQLRENNLVEDFKFLIKEYDVPARYIEVEITEGMLMKSFEHNISVLNRLKDLGMSIALDDFGTGYSSLNYLTKLPIDVLKIDRSFLLDILSNDKSRYIVENIIQLSHKLGITVIAEGVEVKEQVDYLKNILCDGVQGYYFSKPTNFLRIKELMQNKYIYG